MVKIIGPSGIELDVDQVVADGLVDGRHARYVLESDPAGEPEASEAGTTTPPEGAPPESPVLESDPAGEPEASEAGTTTPPEGAPPESPVLESDPAGEKPKGNASIEVWAAYAVAHGKNVDGLNRDEIRSLFKE